MASKNKPFSKEFVSAGIASAVVHCLVLGLGCINVFKAQPPKDMFLNIELAGAAELQEALDNYQNQPSPPTLTQPDPTPAVEPVQEPTPQIQPEPQSVTQPEPTIVEELTQPIIDDDIKDQLVSGPTMLESSAYQEPKPEPEPISEPNENALPQELQQKELEKEKPKQLEQQKKAQELKEKKLKEKKLKEKRLRKKKRKEKERKRKEEIARRKKQRLDAIKRIQKKKSRANRLSKIASVIQQNNIEKSKKNAQIKKTNDAFNKMLNSQMSSSGKPLSSGFGNGLGSYGDGMGISNSDAAIVSSQIIPHWVVAGGVKNAESLRIRIRIKLKNNGEVIPSSIEIVDKDRYNKDRVFKAAADSAKRAILMASPLKIPPNKMHLFRDFEFSFNTDKALGVRK